MAHFLIGSAITAGFLLLVYYVRKNALRVSWRQWIVTIAGFVYSLFVLEVIAAFLAEGTVRGAIVMGTILGFIAVVWGVLLGRLVFIRKSK